MRSTSLPTSPAPQLFFSTPAQRTALARERFFGSGDRPSGLVSEAVFQSWSRCLAARQSPRHAVAFEAVTRARLNAALERSRALLQASGDDITRLESALAGTGASVLLTDAQGVIVHATAHDHHHAPLTRVAARVGVDLSEAQLGTNAPAVVVKTQQAVTVHGAEHFFENVHPLHCAAAPIRDGQGHLAGVLDLTVEAKPFAFDAAALVGIYATLIENRLLQATAAGCLVLQFQVCSSMLGSPLEALVGINEQGRLAWHNGTAQKLLGLDPPIAHLVAHRVAPLVVPLVAHDVEAMFGIQLNALLALTLQPQAAPLRLPNGLTVWLRARASAGQPQPAHAPQPPSRQPAVPTRAAEAEPDATAPHLPAASSSTLDQATGDVIERTLAECDGNVSRAARRLGVSRGLLYRRLRQLPRPPRFP
jgi:sigma-54 dependent transcriptional regulator, acetoin dehydrogenase operon transcriptional activator AcoR